MFFNHLYLHFTYAFWVYVVVGKLGTPDSLVEDRFGCESKVKVVASITKQDSKSSDTTECYVGHVTHFRNDSLKMARQEDTEQQQEPQENKDWIAPKGSMLEAHRQVSMASSKGSGGTSDTNNEARDEAHDLEQTKEAIVQVGILS